MQISTRNRYGLRALMELAEHWGQGPMSIRSIAELQGLSRNYLDSIFSAFKTAGIVRSRPGVGGGHLLAREPGQICLRDVLWALEGSQSLVDCVADAALCPRSRGCVARMVWAEVARAVDRVLGKTTLADLVKAHRSRSDDAGLDAVADRLPRPCRPGGSARGPGCPLSDRPARAGGSGAKPSTSCSRRDTPRRGSLS